MAEVTPSGRYRADIQVMRAVAVLAVVIYHSGFDVLPGGYLGVDIFFVISGFLMGGIILRELEEKRFRLVDFYMRRAIRLLPASLFTLLFTTLAASVLLTWSDWQDYLGQLLGALTFTANYTLMVQTGYFDAAAETKPLLHMWSLSLEEQFYLFLPLGLIFLSKNLRMPALILGAAMSLILCSAMIGGFLPISAEWQQKLLFYSLPTRAWEMLFGCIAASLLIHSPSLRIPPLVSWTAFAAILYLIALPFSSQHPGLDAFIATLATTVLLFSRDGWLPRGLMTDCAVKVGDWSYSIYLVHWPLFAFATVFFLEEAPAIVRIGLIAFSLLLGWSQFRFVEQRFRIDRSQNRNRKALAFAGATAMVGVIGLALPSIAFTSEQRVLRPAANIGLSPACELEAREWNDPAECRRGRNPRVALWGDSFAMHWNPALAEIAGERGLVQITKSACAPLVGLAMLRPDYSEQRAENCIAFNDDVLEKLAANPAIGTVILASKFTQVMVPIDEGQQAYRRGKRVPASINAGISALSETVATLRKAGKRVVIIEPIPTTGIDYGACAVRLTSDRPTAAAVGDCSFPESKTLALYGGAYSAIEAFASAQGVDYVRPRDVLCRLGRCQTIIEGQIIYRDTGHITEFGSRWILNRLDFIDQLTVREAPQLTANR